MNVRTALADGTKLYPGDNKQKEKKSQCSWATPITHFFFRDVSIDGLDVPIKDVIQINHGLKTNFLQLLFWLDKRKEGTYSCV